MSGVRGRAGLAILLLACGGAPAREAASESEGASASTRNAASPTADVATTSGRTMLCGAAGEAAIRRVVPDLPPCDDGVIAVFAAAHTGAGTITVVAVNDVRGEAAARRVVVLDDGVVVDALPAAVPSTPADRDALAYGAILVAQGGPEAFVDAGGRDDVLQRTNVGSFFDALALGPSADGRYGAVGGRTAPSGAWEAAHYEATVDEAGVTHVRTTTLMVADTPGELRVLALEHAPPVASTPRPATVCGDPQEAAVRVRAPDMPPCGAVTSSWYVAASTSVGPFVSVHWHAGDRSGHDTVLGDQILVFGVSAVPPTSDPALLSAVLFDEVGTRDLALDVPAVTAMLGADVGRILPRLRPAALGFHATQAGARTVALGTRDGDDGRTVTAYDVAIEGDHFRVSRRRLSRMVDGHEVDGAEPESESIHADDPFVCLDGL